mmetsp:Transcript_19720/g.61906  ORF Transcript_19720/g.61906 Transcript_19720/m.61906 type:complete len:177 (-) Transcript_19720:56-586(-)
MDLALVLARPTAFGLHHRVWYAAKCESEMLVEHAKPHTLAGQLGISQSELSLLFFSAGLLKLNKARQWLHTSAYLSSKVLQLLPDLAQVSSLEELLQVSECLRVKPPGVEATIRERHRRCIGDNRQQDIMPAPRPPPPPASCVALLLAPFSDLEKSKHDTCDICAVLCMSEWQFEL